MNRKWKVLKAKSRVTNKVRGSLCGYFAMIFLVESGPVDIINRPFFSGDYVIGV